MTMKVETRSTINHDIRCGLALLTDIVLPGTDRLPSGRSVDAHGELLDRVLLADPALVPAVIELGRRASKDKVTSIADIAHWERKPLESAIFALTAAYYMAREVHRALNYPGLRPHPIAEATADEKYSEELLAPVRARGAIYVEAPE
ncbi:hypothetical protein [Rhodococcus opacus]|uniref:hypothetical protein n=1 Tax=Rhodococcus opacus TaxID=37919 RepID=UPI00155A9D30|nr:hypothetical protein [Rhodococcus opacus]